MKTAIIGASSDSVHAIEAARELGITTVALDGNPEAEGLKHADKSIVVDISDEQTVIDTLRGEHIDFVTTVPIGRYLTTIGAVNDALHLPGITRKSAELCTDKYEFHNVLKAKGLRNSHCYLLNKENLRPCYHIQYPAILKPRFGSGSRAIYFLEDQGQLDEAINEIFCGKKSTGMFATGECQDGQRSSCGANRDAEQSEETPAVHLDPEEMSARLKAAMSSHIEKQSKREEPQPPSDEDYVLEEAAPGQEYGIDGVVERYDFQMILLRRKIITPLPAREAVGYISVVPDKEREICSLMRDYISRIVEALGLKDCLIHADVMYLRRKMHVIELSARPSGHNLHNLFTPMATGVDMCREYLAYMSGKHHNFEPLQTRKMMIHYFDMGNCFVHWVPTRDSIGIPDNVKLLKWQCNIRTLDYLCPVTTGHSIMNRGYYILDGQKDEDFAEAAEFIKNQFELS